MFLTVREAAALLAVTERQVYRWVGEAEIPFQRVRHQVRFNRTDLLEWAIVRRLPISPEALDANLDAEDRTPSLMQALRVGGVHHDVPGTDRNSALRAAVERTPTPASFDREFLVEVLTARESAVSAAVGHGIAIPRVRQPIVAPGVAPTVSVSHLRSPVASGAPDETQIQTIFLIVSPTVRAHLQMLVRLGRALLDPAFRAAVERRATTEELAAEAGRLEVAPPPEPPPHRAEGAD
ncbi:MAG: PTS sugar transporter subunit IIA [Deltaproteobacteria bacterium]|nr:PTS sugar transporter subunit IIA [Deltaproteobacteria bacterium]